MAREKFTDKEIKKGLYSDFAIRYVRNEVMFRNSVVKIKEANNVWHT